MLLFLGASASVRTGLLGFRFGSVERREFVPTPLHLFPSRPPPHLPPTRPVLLALPGPSLFGHGSESRPLIGLGRHARVCQQRGGSECAACQPAEGAGLQGQSAHACGPPFSLLPGGGAAGEGAWGACPGFWRGSPEVLQRRRVQGLRDTFASKGYLSSWGNCGGGGDTLGLPGA